MKQPWRLVLALTGPIILANCTQAPTPPPAPAESPSPSPSPAEPAVSPTPAPSASALYQVLPTPPPAPAVADWRTGDVIAFEMPPREDVTQRDLFVYNARLDTVVPMTAANTDADESRPKLSGDRRWLVFQRTVAEPEPRSDVLIFDTETQVEASIGQSDSAANERAPAISRDGRWVAYVADTKDGPQLRLYDLQVGANYRLPSANRAFARIDNPAFDREGTKLVFAAGTRLPNGSSDPLDLFVYDLPTGALWTIPFANTRFNEDNPVLSSDGKRMLFDSDRRGTLDLFEADLVKGVVDTLSPVNTTRFNETKANYYGKDDRLIRYKLFTEPTHYLLQIFDPAAGKIDTLPIANRLYQPAP